jgi:hypothetical protein
MKLLAKQVEQDIWVADQRFEESHRILGLILMEEEKRSQV